MTDFIDLVKTTTTDHEEMEIVVVLKEFPKAKLIVHSMNFRNEEFTYSVKASSWFPPYFKKALEFMSGSHNAAPYLYEVAKVTFGEDLKGLQDVPQPYVPPTDSETFNAPDAKFL